MKPWANYSKQARKRIQPLIDAGDAVCARCGHPIRPGQAWDVGHVLPLDTHGHLADDPANMRPEHRRCNRSAGARQGNRKRGRVRRVVFPEPSREW